MKIWTDDECIEVDPNDVGGLEAAMRFKAEHIKAKADPELFAAVAYMLFRLWDTATKRVDVVRCRECKFRDGTPGQPNIQCGNMHDDDFCSYGEKEGADNG